MSMPHQPARTRVLIESPFAGATPEETALNVRYLRACMRHSFIHCHEYPFASHALYTLPGILDDTVASERALGIEAGLVWGAWAEATIVYLDRGLSKGMRQGILRAKCEGRLIINRRLPAMYRMVLNGDGQNSCLVLPAETTEP